MSTGFDIGGSVTSSDFSINGAAAPSPGPTGAPNRRPVEKISDALITARPTLIVGLGGTGVLIAQWTYHLIHELFGTIPPFIKFLGLDTDAQEEGGPGLLPRSDFINLLDGFCLGEVLRDRHGNPRFHQHLSWLGDMKLDAAIADRGAQGVSRIGRVVFFETWQTIHRAVVARYDQLNGNNVRDEIQAMEPQNQYELGNTPIIHVASSICGGSGSGLLIDMAYALRDWANERFRSRAEVIAHLVLPEAFGIVSPVILDKLQAVAVSTLEQIELLMDHRRPNIQVTYPNGPLRCFVPSRAPFDACFLVNGYGSGGGDDRLHLVQMVGRMIRAMTVEPASKSIASDLNNKKNDILGNDDDQTGRKLCFASYGLRYGTAGIPADSTENKLQRVKRWICKSLQKTTHDCPDDSVGKDVKSLIDNVLDQNKLVQTVGLAGFKEFEWPKTMPPPAPGEDSNQVANRAVIGAVQSYLQMVHGDIKSKAEDAVAKPERRYAFRDKVKAATTCYPCSGNVAAGEKNIPTLAHDYKFAVVGATLLEEHIEDVKKRLFALDRVAVQTSIMNAVENALNDACRKNGCPNYMVLTGTLGRPTITSVVRTPTNLLNLYRAAVLPVYKELLEDNLEDCNACIKAFRELADDAGMVLDAIPSDEDVRLLSESPYATSLFELTHPDKVSNKESDRQLATETTRTRFHEGLIVPIGMAAIEALFHQVDKARAEHRKRGEVAANGTAWLGTTWIEDVLAKQEWNMQAFLEDYEKTWDNEFHIHAVDPKTPSTHPFFDKVKAISDRAVVKIGIDRRNRYSQPLDTRVVQHCPKSCVKGLLGGDVRSAAVAREYEHHTNIWFQVMNFRYGISLVALDMYDEYSKARDRYCHRTTFTPADLMLDPAWFSDHQRLLRRCAEQQARVAFREAEEASGAVRQEQHDLAVEQRRRTAAYLAGKYASRICTIVLPRRPRPREDAAAIALPPAPPSPATLTLAYQQQHPQVSTS